MCRCKVPVIEKYCGICSLRTGICIKSIINLALLLIRLKAIVTLIYALISWIYYEDWYRSSNTRDNQEALFLTTVPETKASLDEIYGQFVVFTVTLLTLTLGYMAVICCTMWAVCKRKGKMLQILFFIHIPNWLFDLIVTLMTVYGLHIIIIIIMCFMRFFEAYNLLAIRSEYLRLMEKIPPTSDNPIEMHQSIPTRLYATTPNSEFATNEVHCRSCTCNLIPKVENTPQSIQQSPLTPEGPPPIPVDNTQPTHENKELNFKEQPIIFDQSQVIEQGSSIVTISADETQPSSHKRATLMMRPTSLALAFKDVEKKIDLSEVPVIYDQSQLNVGSNPILEDGFKVTHSSQSNVNQSGPKILN